MALYATHDTTIAALLCTLDVFDHRWPRFTSNITFELFRDPSASLGALNVILRREKYFVRTRYNNKVVTLPGRPPLLCLFVCFFSTLFFSFLFCVCEDVGMWG